MPEKGKLCMLGASFMLSVLCSCGREDVPVNKHTDTGKPELVLPEGVEPFRYDTERGVRDNNVIPYLYEDAFTPPALYVDSLPAG